MTLAARAQALLALVEHERARQCAVLLDEAQQAAGQQRAASRTEARQRLREAFADERARCEMRLAAARADLRTRQRAHAQRHLEAMLALAWQRLPQVLVQRWQDPATRAAWAAAAWTGAAQALPAGPWQVTHAPGWTEPERRGEQDCAASAQPPRQLLFACDSALGAGLRVAAGGNVLDATLAGLLADRAEIGGQLVGALQDDAAAPPRAQP
ncbi:MAG: hypothetical protein JNJ89_17705 [Rubrivivax sp.]|nr:hypothetical protein [Rubrivivax sp.]